ncbi:hypothetical protein CIB48_g6345 [Xylaria polymorpha]|nr:hypothetical protein CIB48_g6345 [Xylaria polymorpha]
MPDYLGLEPNANNVLRDTTSLSSLIAGIGTRLFAMGHLSNDEFFTKLAALFDSRKGKDHGSIVLTQKRLSYDQAPPEPVNEAVLSDLHPPRPLPVLIRATNAKGKEDREAKQKIKLSTIVEPAALPASSTDTPSITCTPLHKSRISSAYLRRERGCIAPQGRVALVAAVIGPGGCCPEEGRAGRERGHGQIKCVASAGGPVSVRKPSSKRVKLC